VHTHTVAEACIGARNSTLLLSFPPGFRTSRKDTYW